MDSETGHADLGAARDADERVDVERFERGQLGRIGQAAVVHLLRVLAVQDLLLLLQERQREGDGVFFAG